MVPAPPRRFAAPSPASRGGGTLLIRLPAGAPRLRDHTSYTPIPMGRIHLGSILGTTITLDFSFLILTAFFVFSYARSMGMPQALIWAPVLFLSVLIHEMAHAAMIGALGFGESAIVLAGIGGAALHQRPATPKPERPPPKPTHQPIPP